jgi:hypothetical protein
MLLGIQMKRGQPYTHVEKEKRPTITYMTNNSEMTILSSQPSGCSSTCSKNQRAIDNRKYRNMLFDCSV